MKMSFRQLLSSNSLTNARTIWPIFIILAIFLMASIRWIWYYRYNQPLDIDEAGYLCLAMIDYYGLHFGGIHGWIAALGMPSIQAPLTPALTSLLFGVTKPNPYLGFAIPLAGGAGSIGATYALGNACRSARVGLIGAILVASCPVIIMFSCDYQFSMWATLTATLALLAVVRSQHFRNLGWTAIFGVFLGLMPLARTMTIAFVPGMIAAAFLAMMVERAQLWRRLLNLIGGLSLAVLIAGSWFIPNGRLVFGYLLGFGYGTHAKEYGHHIPLLSIVALRSWIKYTINTELFFPHFMILLLGFLILVVIFIRKARQKGVGLAIRDLYRSPLAPVAIFAAEALLALTSTKNLGSAFIAPVVPALMVMTGWALTALSESRAMCAVTSCLVVVTALVAAVPKLDLRSPVASVWVANIPVLGHVNISDGAGAIQGYEYAAGYDENGPTEPITPETGRSWVRLSRWTATILGQYLGPHPSVAFGFRHVLYNVNTVNLARLLQTDSAFDVRQIDPIVTGQSVRGYLRWIQRDNANVCGFLTSNKVRGNFKPLINPVLMKKAAQQAGLVPIQKWSTPDGQEITLWEHSNPTPNCR